MLPECSRGMLVVAVLLLATTPPACAAGKLKPSQPAFQTSDRCIGCHNGLTTASGRDVSIGFDWRSSIMANSSRDPYWQASVRREALDHPEANAAIQDECSVCHMPVTRYEAKLRERLGEIFPHLPFDTDIEAGQKAEDGVTCSVCHQIGKKGLGTRDSFNGNFVIDPPEHGNVHPEYGPFQIEQGNKKIMWSSTGGLQPNDDSHIREAELCASCHQLYTEARGPGGKVIGQLPEQVPYLEWLNSSYYGQKKTCQDCHMPPVNEPAPIAKVLGIQREGVHQHVFVGGDFFMQEMLNRYRDDLSVGALPQELTAAAEGTKHFLGTQAARLSLEHVSITGGHLDADVFVKNLGGHKLPTAFPSRRAWLHFLIRGKNGHIIFESGALNPDGSIVGNDSDRDPSKFEPHYRQITDPDQVQIYESIMGDPNGHVTTGLLTAVRYLKDNRVLPSGFDKAGAQEDIRVRGAAASDVNFTAEGHRIRYSVALGSATGPFDVQVELWYQPIGYRWANNLKPYDHAPEPRRFNAYYDSMDAHSAVMLAQADVTGKL
jgi:hypothetical protein